MEAAVAVFGFVLCLIATQLVAEGVGHALWHAAHPIRRPIWRAFRTASWAWPLLLVVGVSGGGAVLGYSVMDQGGWLEGLGAFSAGLGSFIALISPLLWRDARRSSRTFNDDADEQS